MFSTYRRIYGGAWRAAHCPVIVYTGELSASGARLRCLCWQSNPYQMLRNPIKWVAWENGFHMGMMERGINAR